MKKNKRIRDKMKNNKKKNFQKYIDGMKNNILQHNNDIWIPDNNIQFSNYDSNSWFNIFRYENKNINSIKTIQRVELEEDEHLFRGKKYTVKFTAEQRRRLDIWFDAHASMYNFALEVIKRQGKYNKKVYSWKYLRDKCLKNRKLRVKNFCNIKGEKVDSHVLDQAIKLACKNYKTCLSLIRNKHIKHFRIRRMRKNRTSKIMMFEKKDIDKNVMKIGKIGKFEAFYKSNNKVSKVVFTPQSDFTLHYSKKTDEYTILTGKEIEQEIPVQRKEFISLDPGIRKFMTGITKNEAYKFGMNVANKIRMFQKIINDRNNNKNIPKKIKKKNETLYYRKIKNYVNELHWKLANFLTTNYNNIFIGDMSAKGITQGNTLDPLTKQVVMNLGYYQFRQKLEYKCKTRGVNYCLINERYTSKMCSNCGTIDDNLGASKVYDCKSCNMKIDRDLNGARGIYIKKWLK